MQKQYKIPEKDIVRNALEAVKEEVRLKQEREKQYKQATKDKRFIGEFYF